MSNNTNPYNIKSDNIKTNMPNKSKKRTVIIFCIVTIILLIIDIFSKKLAINSFNSVSDSSPTHASTPSSTFAFFTQLFTQPFTEGFTKFTKFITALLAKFSTKFLTLKYSLTLNTGISFGLFSFTPFIYTKLKYVVLLLVLFMTAFAHRRKYPIYMSFFIAGSTGNLIDRFIYDGVVDFIELIILDSSLFVFNIADMYIQIGLMIYAITHIKSYHFRKNSEFLK